jgi:hypothetical protein
VLPPTYVSATTGNDDNTNCGSSASSPCKTISKAIDNIDEYGSVSILDSSFGSVLVNLNTSKTIEISTASESISSGKCSLSPNGETILFNVTTYLRLANLILKLNSSNNEYVRIGVSGVLTIISVNVIPNSTESTSNSFIVGSGGIIQFSNSEVNGIKFGDNSRFLTTDGNLSISMNNCSFTEINLRCGGLIFGNNSNFNISIVGVTVANLTINIPENVFDGGFVSVKRGRSINIRNSVFTNISGIFQGGVFYFEKVSNTIMINNNSFKNCSVHGYGGALMFNVNSTFQIVDSNFTNCLAELRGGAISSFSNITGIRIIQNCYFIGNNLSPSDRLVGIDIYDGSNYSHVYYFEGTVLNCTSDSVAEGDNILFGGSVAGEPENFLIFDCYLKGNCDPDEGGIFIHPTNGQDYEACGSSGSPCKNLMYGVNKTLSNQWVNILYDQNVYTIGNVEFPGRIVLVRGINSDALEKPILQSLFTTWSNMFILSNQDSYTTLDNFIIKYNTSGSNNRFLVYAYASAGEFIMRYFILLLCLIIYLAILILKWLILLRQ